MPAVSVDISPTYLIPDILVTSRAPLLDDVNLVPAREVLLAVEIVSPSSRTMDRVTKPAKYAEAGIQSYWRVEMSPAVSLNAYELRGDSYVDVGTWGPGETAFLERPFPITIPIDAITPPPATQADG